QSVSVTGAPPSLTVSFGTVTRLGAGLQVTSCCTVTLSQAAPVGGLAVTLTSNNATRLLVATSPIPVTGGSGTATLSIPAGGTSGTFSLQGLEGASGPVTVTATAPGYTAGTSPSVTVEAPVQTLFNLSSSQSPTGPNDDFQVRVG